MHILIDARMSGLSTGKYIDKLIEYLQKIDSSNQYFLLLKNSRLEIYNNMPSNFHTIQCDVKEFTFAEQIKLLNQVKNLKPDLVHFPMAQHPILFKGKKVIGILDLTTLRFNNPSKNLFIYWIKQKLYWFVNYMATRKANSIITISEYVKKDVVKTFGANPDKITVTYNAADKIIDSSEAVSLLTGKKFIMYVGRHMPHKNLDRLIEAHQKLLEKNPDLILAVAGKKDSVTEILEKNISEKGYKNIVFTGFVSDGQLRWMYENTSCYVFPSLSEGFGLPGLEAMIHGAPVASSSATCLPEIYGDAAEYFDPKNTDEMTAKINLILNDTGLRSKLIQKGKEQAKKYSWKRMAEQTLQIYEKAFTD
jgi:glycosyltransferase involved in cell wall biosynthesis